MTLDRLLRIARWEVAKSAGTVDRRTVAVLLVAVVASGLVAPSVLGGGVALDEGIYRVAVDEDSQYHDPVVDHSSLRVVDDPGAADLVVEGARVRAGQSDKSQAALAELRTAVQAYNTRRLETESDRAAAFPVNVSIRYEQRDGGGLVDVDDPTDDGPAPGDDPTGDDSTVGDDTADDDSIDDDSTVGDDTADDDAGGDSTVGDDSTAGDDTADDPPPGDDSGEGDAPTDDDAVPDADDGGEDPIQVPDVGSSGGFGGADAGSPATISPPFPFASLVLAFLFVIPMNFVIQAYGSTIMDERLNRRGELLLVSPASRLDIVTGKTLPYFCALLAVTVLIATVVGGGVLSVFAVVPVALLFLAATFVGAMFARSYKELTFVTVTISVLLTTYVFVPAIFTDVTPIALISPLSLVVMDLQGESVRPLGVVFSTGPFFVASAVLFGLGTGIYREEDMFTQRPVHRKALDALAAWLHRYRDVAMMGAILLPFVFVLELLAVALLFALPMELTLPVLLIAIALIEEVAKSIHVLAAYEHDRFERTLPIALAVGVASGTGFFLAEKATHVVQFVGLHELDLGTITFTPELGVGPGLAVALFFLPLALHSVTAAISAVGARDGGYRYLLALSIAVLVHTLYNLGVIAVVT